MICGEEPASAAREEALEIADQDTLVPMAIDVVSVQSQVVYGTVGNNAAVPTLMAHGLNVAAVPTVVLSNTPHYPTLHGGALPAAWFEGYLGALRDRGALQRLRAVLVGYLGNPEQASILSRWIDSVRERRGDVNVIVDPVIGDVDVGMHVCPDMVDAWRRHLLPVADALVPNGFELAILANRPTGTVAQTIDAARDLLNQRLRWIVVTSAAPDSCAAGQIRIACVTKDHAALTTHPRLPIAPKGTGDLFSAKLTALLLDGVAPDAAVRPAWEHVFAALQLSHRTRSRELLLSPPQPATGAPPCLSTV